MGPAAIRRTVASAAIPLEGKCQVSRRISTATAQKPLVPLGIEEVEEIDLGRLNKGTTFTNFVAPPFHLPDRKTLIQPEFNFTPAEQPATYLERLIGYIPAEVIALYLGASKIVPVTEPRYWMELWVIAALSAVCVPLYMYFAIQETGKPTLWAQVIISSIAFPIWVFAIGGPFRSFSWYDEKQWIAAILISFFTFLAGLYQPKSDPPARLSRGTHKPYKPSPKSDYQTKSTHFE